MVCPSNLPFCPFCPFPLLPFSPFAKGKRAKGQKGKMAKEQKGKKGKSTNRMPKSFWAQFKMEAGTANSTKNTSTMTPSTSKSLAEKTVKEDVNSEQR